mmetsp:Transcript_31621/g.28016  ORF Transcript_31621/g.28016 Transcript_31621/m.28016 type:complete len:176 (-) Transcript_31621:39-566(-)
MINKHGILPEVERRLNTLGISNKSLKPYKQKQTIAKTFLSKRGNPRETFTRGESNKNPFDLDYAEDEQWEPGQLTRSYKLAGSHPKIIKEGERISKPMEDSGARMIITNKTRQSMRPYQSRDLRIKNKPARVYRAGRRGESAHVRHRKKLGSSRKPVRPKIGGENISNLINKNAQ